MKKLRQKCNYQGWKNRRHRMYSEAMIVNIVHE